MPKSRVTAERWTQIEELFHRAAECAPEHRAATLDDYCGADAELRRQVEALLSCDGNAGDSVQAAVRDGLDNVGFPLTGETISHYHILDGLGGGGMGLVYRAEDIKLGRRVALKFLPEESVKDPAALGRFEREARSASALEHPNICPIYEFGEHEGQPFLVMQLLEGQTLRDLIASAGPGKPPLELSRLLDLAVQIVEGLDAAHQKGIIHRDIKPANIFITREGQAKILDFGLAKLASMLSGDVDDSAQNPRGEGHGERTLVGTAPMLTPDLFLSRTGMAMGTAGYMSPEQVRGEKLDACSDLFSFGLVLYEMATGKRAFAGETGPELQEAILTQMPRPAREVNPELPAKLQEIIRKALEKGPEARYQTASEMHAELETLKRDTAPRAPSRRQISASALVVFALLILLLLPATGYFAWQHFRSGAQPPAGKIMLAVLPFQNLTGDPGQDYFSDGFTEEMINALGALQPERLGVIARPSVMRYKHSDRPQAQIGRELGVQYFLEGSVRREAGLVRISAQLVRTDDQTHLWAENYQRDQRDVFAVQNELAEAIAGQIRLHLTMPEQARLATARPLNPEAHEAYLLGRFNWNKRTHDGLTTGLNYFQKAVSLDAKDPLGYTGIADSYIALAVYGHLLPTEAFPRAKEAVLKALELDDTLADAHSTLAQIYQSERDWAGTERQCKRALALNPSYALGHERYSLFLTRVQRHEEAITEAKRASELDPLSPLMTTVIGQALYFARHYNESQQELLKALQLDPNFFTAHTDLGDLYAAMGMFDKSIAELEKAASLSSGDLGVQAELAYVYAKMGRKGDAENVLKKLQSESQRRYVSGYLVSGVFIGLGRRGEAMEWLERADLQKDYQLSWISVSPVFDPLRSDPRFTALLRRLGLPQQTSLQGP
jgi:serine/threonine protein kinase/TolB-like protein/Tfp pilus assembly protein PilF